MKKIDVNGYFGRLPVRIEGVYREEDFLKTMDRFEIERCAIKTTWAVFDITHEGNAEMLELVGRHPDRFLGVAVVNPFRDDIIEQIDHYHGQGAKALALYPPPRGYTLAEHDLLAPVLNEAMEREMPVYILVLPMKAVQHFPGTPIDSMKGLAEAFPKVHFLLAGVGLGHWNRLKLMKHLPNVSIEISLYSGYDGVRRFVEMYGSERVFFGTGYGTTIPGVAVERVETADITEEDMANIYYNNAARLFGLK